ncbi:MAG: LUD domain-containing protein [Chloroflexi bacterium]|nr:LUD domain-containing protein [Chloroflexota bacterium]
MSPFRARARAEIEAGPPAATLSPILRKLVADSRDQLATASPSDARARAQAARAYAVDHLDELQEQLKESCARQGIGYHRAATAEEAVALVTQLLGDARRIAKSKSMVAEEVGLTHALRVRGKEVLETDIGEYIVDIEGRGPSHITAPALHLNRARIRDLLAGTGEDVPDDDPVRLSRAVRDVVAEFFGEVDAGITGANAVIADSGRIVIVENEGNVSLGVSRPRLHIAITGMEKVVADEEAALAVLQVLAPSATAQPLTAYTHFLGAPDEGQERHLVVVDNGRSEILADERYRDVLRCIRCGACMNACPVYTAAGGLSYGSPYMGPIGAVVSPLLWPDGRHADLPSASSLCGRCSEVCPVGIPLHRMLLDLRAGEAENGGSRVEKVAWKSWAAAFGGRQGRVASWFARLGLRAGGRLPGLPVSGSRPIPAANPSRDPAMLVPLDSIEPEPEPATVPLPDDVVAAFRERASLVGAVVVDEAEREDGDRRVRATAAVASTGSVLLTGQAAARGALMDARRIIVEVDEASVVRFPQELGPALAGDGDALILTGASRTADIEKQIVRGIHGPEALVVVVGSGTAQA